MMYESLRKYAILVAYKRGGMKEINRIHNEIKKDKKQEFFIMVCGIPAFFFVFFLGAYFTNGYFTGDPLPIHLTFIIPIISFVVLLIMWFFVRLQIDLEDNQILEELKKEGRIK